MMANSNKRPLDLLKTVNLGDFGCLPENEPNLIETLTELKKQNVGRAISTNRTTSMKSIMERFNLDPYFEMVMTTLDVKHPKPHPESVEDTLLRLKYDGRRHFISETLVWTGRLHFPQV